MAGAAIDGNCPVCKDVFLDPCVLSCGDVLCRYCIGIQERNGSLSTITCPVCMKKVDSEVIKPATAARHQPTKQTSTCKLCRLEVPFGEVKAHEASCMLSKKRGLTNSTDRPAIATPSSGASSSAAAVTPVGSRANRYAFSCPYCHEGSYDRRTLVEHCLQLHSDSDSSGLVCPICSAMPWGSAEQVSKNLIMHLLYRHQYDYDRMVDCDIDDDEALEEAIRRSLGS